MQETTEQIRSDAAPVEGYITKQEVARRLKKSIRTVENWQRKGLIPFVKAGHSVLFNWPAVQAHLNQNFGVNRLSLRTANLRTATRVDG